jgi:ribosomal protein S18 acetylase RimI-like enzyme
MPIVIRRAGAADAVTVSALNVDVQAVHAQALSSRFKPPGADTFPPSEVARLFESAANLVFIAEVDGEASGYAYAEIIRRAETSLVYAHELVYLHHLSVRPAFRRRGIGNALVGAVRAAADQAGIATIALDVWTFNEPAGAFFRRHGFVPYNERLWNA